MQVEDGLAAAGADVHQHPVVGEANVAGGGGDEVEHALGLLRRKLGNLAKRVDVPLGEHEQMRLGLRIDVSDRYEAVGLRNVVAVARELAEEAIVRQRGSPPR